MINKQKNKKRVRTKGRLHVNVAKEKKLNRRLGRDTRVPSKKKNTKEKEKELRMVHTHSSTWNRKGKTNEEGGGGQVRRQ